LFATTTFPHRKLSVIQPESERTGQRAVPSWSAARELLLDLHRSRVHLKSALRIHAIEQQRFHKCVRSPVSRQRDYLSPWWAVDGLPNAHNPIAFD